MFSDKHEITFASVESQMNYFKGKSNPTPGGPTIR